jgi:hypothetical protein
VPVIYDFHGERSGLVSEAGPSSESYDKGTAACERQLFGAVRRIHGWYWEKSRNRPVDRSPHHLRLLQQRVSSTRTDAPAARSPAARRAAPPPK